MADIEKNYPVSVQPTPEMLAEIEVIRAELDRLSPIKGKITTTDVLRYAVRFTATGMFPAAALAAQAESEASHV